MNDVARLPVLASTLLAFIASSSPALAQDFNIDVGELTPFGVPSSTYGGAAHRPGVWINVVPPMTQLTDITGATTNVTLHGLISGMAATDNPNTQGDDEALMDDLQTISLGFNTQWTFNGLANGTYALYTYAWRPDCPGCRSSVFAGLGSISLDPTQLVGGLWPGAHVLGTTFARHRFVVTNGTLSIGIGTALQAASVNGLQLERLDTPTVPFCSGDGSGSPCPCGNSGAAGSGCANSVTANGARLDGVGIASATYDSFVLNGSGMPSSSALYFQGTAQASGGAGAIFGDGLRCAAGTVTRLAVKQNSPGGTSQYPDAADMPISVRGHVPEIGGTRTYQCWYRNNAGPCGSGFNLTNGVQLTWVP